MDTDMDTCFRQKGHVRTRVGETDEGVRISETSLIMAPRHSLAQSDEDCEWRDRRDSNPRPPA